MQVFCAGKTLCKLSILSEIMFTAPFSSGLLLLIKFLRLDSKTRG